MNMLTFATSSDSESTLSWSTGDTSNTSAYTSNIVHGSANEGDNLTLTAPSGTVFTAVNFASYGTPNGSAGSFSIGNCHASNSQTIVEGLLLGNSGSITIPATNSTFGDPCGGTVKSLYVSATYSSGSLTNTETLIDSHELGTTVYGLHNFNVEIGQNYRLDVIGE